MTPHLWRIFLWQVVRDVRRHPLLAALNVFSVALGIAVYLAIQIANQAANHSFAATVDFVAGKAQLEVRGEVDENLWPQLAHADGVTAATGIVEGIATLPDFPGDYLRIVGVDLFSGERFRTFSPRTDSATWNLESWLGQSGVVALPEEFARTHHLKPGDHFRVTANGEIREFTLLTTIDTSASPMTNPRFALMDIGWVQELFGRPGKLSAVQLLLEHPDHAAEVAARLNAMLPADLRAEPPQQRSFQLQHMVSAFQLNLTALSMVSLLVGVFLIYNTIAAAVIRRRREIGILRCLGATRLEIRTLFLGEACFFGLLGIVAGSIGGIALAQVLSGAVARTITSLYVLSSIDRAWPSAAQIVIAATYGLAAVLVGAWLPASEAAEVDPVAALSLGDRMERAESRHARWSWLAPVCLLVAGAAAWLALRGGPPVLAFVGAFFVLVCSALLSPAATRLAGKSGAALTLRLDIAWKMAAQNLTRFAHRNAMTVAALSAAIAMLTGLTVMIFSFRQSVTAWIDHGIVADLLIAPAANEQVGRWAYMPDKAIDWIKARPEVLAIDTIREQPVQVKAGESAELGPAVLLTIGGEFRHNLHFRGGDDDAKAARVFGGDSVAVTESFSRRYGVGEGGHITLLTPHGAAEFPIAGVYADYSRDQGVVLMERRNFNRLWDEPGVHTLAVFLRPGASAESMANAFRAQFSREGEFAVYSNRELRGRVLAIFEQTFAITAVLRTVALLVAITGVYLSVLTLVAEREREIGTLRALGASRGQIQRLLMTESGAVGLVAALLGLAAGAALALILTNVVNPAFFGWTFDLAVPWRALLVTPIWMAAAAALAAWHPAWKAVQRNIAIAVREE